MTRDDLPASPGWSIAFSSSLEWPCYGLGKSVCGDGLDRIGGAQEL